MKTAKIVSLRDFIVVGTEEGWVKTPSPNSVKNNISECLYFSALITVTKDDVICAVTTTNPLPHPFRSPWLRLSYSTSECATFNRDVAYTYALEYVQISWTLREISPIGILTERLRRIAAYFDHLFRSLCDVLFWATKSENFSGTFWAFQNCAGKVHCVCASKKPRRSRREVKEIPLRRLAADYSRT